MVWWITGGIVVAGVLVLLALFGAVRRDVAELRRVADLGRERAGFAQRRLQARSERLLQTLGELDELADATQRRLETVRADHPTSGGR